MTDISSATMAGPRGPAGTNGTNGIDGADGLMTGATDEETQAGAIDDKSVTPKSLASIIRVVVDGQNRILFLDENGYALFYAELDGLHAPNIDALAPAIPLAQATQIDDAPGAAMVLDSEQYGWRIDPLKIEHPKFVEVKRKADKVALGSGAARVLATLNHILLYGQSVSIAYAAIHTNSGTGDVLTRIATMPWAKMFQGGIRSRDFGASGRDALANLVEARTGLFPFFGETFASGAAAQIQQMLLEEDGIDINDLGAQFLFSAPGEGSKSISQLSNGTTYFTRLEEDMDYSLIRAEADSRSYLLQGVFWAQGEQDNNDSTSTATYMTRARTLQDDIRAYQATITGVDQTVPFFTYQNASHTANSKPPNVPYAHLDLADADDDWILAVIMYIFDYQQGEHLTAMSSRLAGAYYGLALKRWLFDGVKHWHLSPGTPVWSGKSVMIPFSHVDGGLAFDTSRVSDPGNYGFTLVDNVGASITINTPVIVGNSVVITSSSTIPSGSELRYARGTNAALPGRTTGARGCLRDRQGDRIKFADGGDFPLHKYAPIFRKVKP